MSEELAREIEAGRGTDEAVALRRLPRWKAALARLCWEWCLFTYFGWGLRWGWWNNWAARFAGQYYEHDASLARPAGETR